MTEKYKRYILSATEDEGGFRGTIRRADGRFIAFRNGAGGFELMTTTIFEKEADALASARMIADAAELA